MIILFSIQTIWISKAIGLFTNTKMTSHPIATYLKDTRFIRHPG